MTRKRSRHPNQASARRPARARIDHTPRTSEVSLSVTILSHSAKTIGTNPSSRPGSRSRIAQAKISLGRLISTSKLPASDSIERALVLEASSSMSPRLGSTMGAASRALAWGLFVLRGRAIVQASTSVLAAGCAGEESCSPAARREFGREGDDCEHDRHADQRARNAPQESEEKYHEHHRERRDQERRARGKRLEIVANEELDGGKSGEDDDDRLPGIELSDGEERGQERGDEGTDKRDVVEREAENAPGGGGLETGEEREEIDRDTGQKAEHGPHQQVAAKLGGEAGARADELLPVERGELPPELLDFEQRHHQEHKHEDGKAREPVESHGDVLEQAQQPDHVETFGENAGNEDAAFLKPLRRLHIHDLEALHVAQQPVADGAERPSDQRGEDQDHDDGDGKRDEEGETLGERPFERFLERPDDGEDEESEGERREDRACEIERGDEQDQGANDEGGAHDPAAGLRFVARGHWPGSRWTPKSNPPCPVFVQRRHDAAPAPLL